MGGTAASRLRAAKAAEKIAKNIVKPERTILKKLIMTVRAEKNTNTAKTRINSMFARQY